MRLNKKKKGMKKERMRVENRRKKKKFENFGATGHWGKEKRHFIKTLKSNYRAN